MKSFSLPCLFTAFFILNTCLTSAGQRSHNKLLPLTADTILKKFEVDASDSLYALKADKSFAYMQFMDSLLRQTHSANPDTISLAAPKGFKNKRVRIKPELTNTDNFFSSFFVKMFFWILAIGFISFIIYKLFITEGVFKRTLKTKHVHVQDEDEAVSPSDYDDLINNAITIKNYHIAVRFLYLQTLHNLSLAGLIHFSSEKTNNEYVKELTGKAQQDQFASLTLNYEYVWYGNFDVDAKIFDRIHQAFKQYNQQLLTIA